MDLYPTGPAPEWLPTTPFPRLHWMGIRRRDLSEHNQKHLLTRGSTYSIHQTGYVGEDRSAYADLRCCLSTCLPAYHLDRYTVCRIECKLSIRSTCPHLQYRVYGLSTPGVVLPTYARIDRTTNTVQANQAQCNWINKVVDRHLPCLQSLHINQ